jgi:hypothetical protein
VGADALAVIPANTHVANGDTITCLWIKGS